MQMARHGQGEHHVERHLLDHEAAVLAHYIDTLLVRAHKAVATDGLPYHHVALVPCVVLSIFANVR
jgi:hypothetical protein